MDTLTLKPTTFRLETEIMDALAAIRDRDGVAVSEQVRRALKQWIAEKGVKMKADRKRAETRKRS
jgi:ribbon-helix-helix CopG family protein